MIIKLTQILLFSLAACIISFVLYPYYIKLLKKRKAGQQIRDTARSGWEASIFKELHAHKQWTPTMWWGLFLIVMVMMVIISFMLQQQWYINNSLFNRNETYVLLFAFFSMWILGLVDDVLNVKWTWDIKWLTSNMKFIWMFLFSWFISWWFYDKLDITYLNLRPFAWEVQLWLLLPLLSFIFTVWLVNAVNITDGLDGLVGGMILIVLWVLGIMAFTSQWYLATTIIGIVIWSIIAFLWFNINPAKVFMWDAWSLGLGWLIATMVYLLNINTGIIIPFILLFLIFWIEIWSSMLQMTRKRLFKRKLFLIAPFHHYLEKKWLKEHSIVMKFRLIQSLLWAIVLVMLFFQLQG